MSVAQGDEDEDERDRKGQHKGVGRQAGYVEAEHGVPSRRVDSSVRDVNTVVRPGGLVLPLCSVGHTVLKCGPGSQSVSLHHGSGVPVGDGAPELAASKPPFP